MTDDRRGVLYVLTSAVMFSGMSVLAKSAGTRIPLPEIIVMRGAVTLALTSAVMRRRGLPLWGARRDLLLLRGVFGFAALVCYFYAVTHLPLADATLIYYCHPVFTLLLAAATAGDPLQRREVFFVLAAFVGVVLVVRPPLLFGGAADDPFALAAAFLAALISAGVYVLIRGLRHSDDPLRVVFYGAWVSALLAAPWAAAVWVAPTGREWATLAGMGACSFVHQASMARGLHLVRAGRASGLGYVQVPLAMAAGLIFFAEPVEVTAWIGAAVVALGATMLASDRPRPPPAPRT